MSRGVKKRGRPFSATEKMLVFSPLFVLVLIGVWQLWNRNFKAILLEAPVHPTQLMDTLDGYAIGWGYPKGLRAFPLFFRWNVQTRTLEKESHITVWPYKPILSPDGKKLAFFDGASGKPRNTYWIEVRDISNITLPGVRWSIGSTHHNLVWTPDGRSIIVCSDQARVYDAETGKLQRAISLRRWLPDGLSIKSITFSPNGRQAAILEDATYLKPTTGPHGQNNDDGGYYKGRLLIVEWPGLKLQTKLPGDLWGTCVWTKDGKQLVALTNVLVGYEALQTKIARFDFATQQTSWVEVQYPKTENSFARHAPYFANSFDGISFSPGGRFLVDEKRTVKGGRHIWDTSTGQHLAIIGTAEDTKRGHYLWSTVPEFSADGRYLLHPTPKGVEMWDLERLRPRY